MARAQSRANNVRVSRDTCLVTCHVSCYVPRGAKVRKDSSTIKFDRVEIALIWGFVLPAEPLTDEGGEETGVPGENPWRRASENATN